MFHPLPPPPHKIMVEQPFECPETSCRFNNSVSLVVKKGGKKQYFEHAVLKYLSVCVVNVVRDRRALKLAI